MDVVHTVAYGTVMSDLAVLWGRLLGKRVFISDVGGRPRRTLSRYVNVARIADGLILLSKFANTAFPGTRPARWVVYGGVDTSRFKPGGTKRIGQALFVGRLLPHKGVDYLVEAVPADLPLVLIGRAYDARYLSRLKELALGKSVRFITDAGEDEIITEMRRSSVVVLPSVSRDCYGDDYPLPELFGLALVEAMACGTPAVATRTGSLPEVVQDGVTGLVVPPNNPAALRAAITRIVTDTSLATELGGRARTVVEERFTWQRVAQDCIAIYEGRAEPTVMSPSDGSAPVVS